MTTIDTPDLPQINPSRKVWQAPILTCDDMRDAEALSDLFSGPKFLIAS
ncbi:hypothetical protein GCM10011505_06720 [Tistrella bauzanensis]|uniref:Uncharacterized protein n=1 Tax=Tistrella bauzanensis TaxID=657419 RepID=A0ABQ1IAT8_9PROT|nr:hypothetical protein [Tistrella bauzanensis]GGB28111.1 hypothetical protein GCM10011505_06720 [Tistrella bauzanensis]